MTAIGSSVIPHIPFMKCHANSYRISSPNALEEFIVSQEFRMSRPSLYKLDLVRRILINHKFLALLRSVL